jgi:hypothetical protein
VQTNPFQRQHSASRYSSAVVLRVQRGLDSASSPGSRACTTARATASPWADRPAERSLPPGRGARAAHTRHSAPATPGADTRPPSARALPRQPPAPAAPLAGDDPCRPRLAAPCTSGRQLSRPAAAQPHAKRRRTGSSTSSSGAERRLAAARPCRSSERHGGRAGWRLRAQPTTSGHGPALVRRLSHRGRFAPTRRPSATGSRGGASIHDFAAGRRALYKKRV